MVKNEEVEYNDSNKNNNIDNITAKTQRKITPTKKERDRDTENKIKLEMTLVILNSIIEQWKHTKWKNENIGEYDNTCVE